MSELLTIVFMIIGATFLVLAALGAVRMPDLYTRLSAATKAVTLGAGAMFVAVATSFHEVSVVTRAIAGIAFFLITAPVAAHMIARAGYRIGVAPWEKTVANELTMGPREEDRREPAAAPAAED